MALLLSTPPISTASPTARSHLRPFLSLHPTKPSVLSPTRRRRILSPPQVTAPPANTIEEQQEHYKSAEIDIEDSEESSSSNFSWRDHWYPVSLVEDLNPSLPTPFQLLNRDLVLWFDRSSSQWAAFDDKCPHRLAPLSVSISNPLIAPK